MKIRNSKSAAQSGSTLFIILIITGLAGLVLAAYLTLLSSENAATVVSLGGSTSNYLARGVRCAAKQEFMFTKAMVAKGNINLSGNNVTTDSFDSGNTNYSTNGHYDSTKAKDGGDVATDSSVTNSL